MADITCSASLNISKGLLSNNVQVTGITADMTVAGFQSNTYALSGTPTNISTATLTAVGIALVRNISASTASTCAIGIVSGGSMVPFSAPRAGEVCVLRLVSGSNYQATGSTDARIRIDITEG